MKKHWQFWRKHLLFNQLDSQIIYIHIDNDSDNYKFSEFVNDVITLLIKLYNVLCLTEIYLRNNNNERTTRGIAK